MNRTPTQERSSSPLSTAQHGMPTSSVLAALPVSDLIRFVSAHIEEAAAALDVTLARPARSQLATRRLMVATKESIRVTEQFGSARPRSSNSTSLTPLPVSSQRDGIVATPVHPVPPSPLRSTPSHNVAEPPASKIRAPSPSPPAAPYEPLSAPAASPQVPQREDPSSRPSPKRRDHLRPPPPPQLDDHDEFLLPHSRAPHASDHREQRHVLGTRVPLHAPHADDLRRTSHPDRRLESSSSEGFPELTPLSSQARDEGRSPSPNRPEPLPTRKLHAGPAAARQQQPKQQQHTATGRNATVAPMPFERSVASAPHPTGAAKPDVPSKAAAVPAHTRQSSRVAFSQQQSPPPAPQHHQQQPFVRSATDVNAASPHHSPHSSATTPRRPAPASETCLQVWSTEKHRQLGELLEQFPSPTAATSSSSHSSSPAMRSDGRKPKPRQRELDTMLFV